MVYSWMAMEIISQSVLAIRLEYKLQMALPCRKHLVPEPSIHLITDPMVNMNLQV